MNNATVFTDGRMWDWTCECLRGTEWERVPGASPYADREDAQTAADEHNYLNHRTRAADRKVRDIRRGSYADHAAEFPDAALRNNDERLGYALCSIDIALKYLDRADPNIADAIHVLQRAQVNATAPKG